MLDKIPQNIGRNRINEIEQGKATEKPVEDYLAVTGDEIRKC